MRMIVTLLSAIALIGGLLFSQSSKQELFDQFQTNKSDPTKAYSVAKRYLSLYSDDSQETSLVKRWVEAYERVSTRASEQGIGGYPVTLATKETGLRKGHIYLEPNRLVFKGDNWELTIPKSEIEKAEFVAVSKWSENDNQGFVLHTLTKDKKNKKKKYGFYASSEAWVRSNDKTGKMVDPRPLIDKINAWLQ